jgi:hypothetical protein
MRQREITWQGWRVSWPDVDGGRHTFEDDDRSIIDDEVAQLRREGVADVRVHRVTRYRLAPLVEIAAWRQITPPYGMPEWVAGDSSSDPQRASVWYSPRCGWVMRICGPTTIQCDGYFTRKAAMAAAEAHLAVLGYRVAKEKRR